LKEQHKAAQQPNQPCQDERLANGVMRGAVLFFVFVVDVNVVWHKHLVDKRLWRMIGAPVSLYRILLQKSRAI
jgi:hypothetical protein